MQAVDKTVLALREKLIAQAQLKKALMHALLTGKKRINPDKLLSS